MGQLGIPQCVHYFPWYSGMGWTLGIWVLCMGHLGIPQCVHYFPRYSGMGWTLGIGVMCMGQLGIPTVCPLLPMVQWDGMDTWDWSTVHGTAWDSHSDHINMHKLVYGMRCYTHRTARKSIFVGCAGLSLSGTHISESEYN